MSENSKHDLTRKELLQRLNSTELGGVITGKQWDDRICLDGGCHFQSCGKTNLIKLAAWACTEVHSYKKSAVSSSSYEAKKERERSRNAEASASGRDIGPIPAVKNLERKEAARNDLLFYCRTYYPGTFDKPFSDDHLLVIREIETCILRGGVMAIAMPRGSGKTTLCQVGALWAISYGHRNFVFLIGASESYAVEMLDFFYEQFDTNELLQEDFPEICYPIGKIDGVSNRCKGQLCCGKRTKIRLSDNEIQFPTIEGSAASGAIVRVAGILGRIRGQKKGSRRPDLFIGDDLQTEESANSDSQCTDRLKILKNAVLGLAGPGKTIAGFVPCTVIRKGDLADQLLDRKENPLWCGIRTKMLNSFPKNEEAWDLYAEVLRSSFANGNRGTEATAYYLAHRDELDEGAAAAWPARYEAWEASAIQNAMNIRILKGEEYFYSECQNTPLNDDDDEILLTPELIMSRINRIPRGVVPVVASRITMFVDVMKHALYWMVCAWEENFTGYVVDYGTFPEQPKSDFTYKKIPITMEQYFRKKFDEDVLSDGITTTLSGKICESWRREDGSELRVDRCFIDIGWSESKPVIERLVRSLPYGNVILPSIGEGVTAKDKPYSAYVPKPGERYGLHWRVPFVRGTQRMIRIDTNYWKSFIQNRLTVPIGAAGSISLFGNHPRAHISLSKHLTSEKSTRTEGHGRTVYQWEQKPNTDNHWLDCLVGCAVAASFDGVVLESVAMKRVVKTFNPEAWK